MYMVFGLFYNYSGVPATKYPTSELVRRKNAGQPLEDVEEKTVRPRGKKTWTGKLLVGGNDKRVSWRER